MKYVFHVNLQWRLEKKWHLSTKFSDIYIALKMAKTRHRVFGKITDQIPNFLVSHKLHPGFGNNHVRSIKPHTMYYNCIKSK